MRLRKYKKRQEPPEQGRLLNIWVLHKRRLGSPSEWFLIGFVMRLFSHCSYRVVVDHKYLMAIH